MRLRGFVLCLAGVLLVGCGGSDESGDGEVLIGGQTGSLIPSCGGIPALDQGYTVPSGDSVFVVYTDQCSGGLAATDVSLSDSTGRPISFELEAVEDGAALVRAAEALLPGEYQVTTPNGTEPLVVAEPEPLPETLGEAFVVDASSCGVTIELQLDPATEPFLSLMSVDVSVDGERPVPWIEFGSLDVEGDVATLRLDCETMCLSAGTHTITLSATIAGETVQPAPVTVQANVSCGRPNDDRGGCAVVHNPSNPAGSDLLVVLGLSMFAFGLRRTASR